jgi:uncharacterized membrane protein
MLYPGSAHRSGSCRAPAKHRSERFGLSRCAGVRRDAMLRVGPRRPIASLGNYPLWASRVARRGLNFADRREPRARAAR